MKTIDEMIAVMTAFRDGKKIEQKDWEDDNRVDCERPIWDWSVFEFRIKPEEQKPKYINIDKAVEWFGKYLFEIGYPDDWVRDSHVLENGEKRFRKAMMKQYNIKPEKPKPTYRPYKSAEELEEGIKEHGLWLRKKGLNLKVMIIGYINERVYTVNEKCETFEIMFEYYEWADGTPFGRRVE